MSEKNEKLTKKELRKFSLRYAITAQASQSYEAMQGIACVYSMGPFFEKWFADDPELMQKKYQKEYDCSKMVAAYIEEETKCSLSGEEIMYLAIHIRRVTTAEE